MSQKSKACENHFEQRYFEGLIHNFLRHILPALLLEDSAGRTAREVWLRNQKFYPVDNILPRFSMTIGLNLEDEQ
jgi:hypothetical protein